MCNNITVPNTIDMIEVSLVGADGRLAYQQIITKHDKLNEVEFALPVMVGALVVKLHTKPGYTASCDDCDCDNDDERYEE